jgi:hypothetical protein
MGEQSAGDIEVLARAVGLVVTPERVPVLVREYTIAQELIETLHTVETDLVPEPFDPAWEEPETGTER